MPDVSMPDVGCPDVLMRGHQCDIQATCDIRDTCGYKATVADMSHVSRMSHVANQPICRRKEFSGCICRQHRKGDPDIAGTA